MSDRGYAHSNRSVGRCIRTWCLPHPLPGSGPDSKHSAAFNATGLSSGHFRPEHLQSVSDDSLYYYLHLLPLRGCWERRNRVSGQLMGINSQSVSYDIEYSTWVAIGHGHGGEEGGE